MASYTLRHPDSREALAVDLTTFTVLLCTIYYASHPVVAVLLVSTVSRPTQIEIQSQFFQMMDQY